jgi:hypothetical protein
MAHVFTVSAIVCSAGIASRGLSVLGDVVVERVLFAAIVIPAALMFLPAVASAVDCLRDRPRLALRPTGVHIRVPYGERTVPWDALEPGQPLRSTDLYTLTLTVRHPELVSRRGLCPSPPGCGRR